MVPFHATPAGQPPGLAGADCCTEAKPNDRGRAGRDSEGESGGIFNALAHPGMVPFHIPRRAQPALLLRARTAALWREAERSAGQAGRILRQPGGIPLAVRSAALKREAERSAGRGQNVLDWWLGRAAMVRDGPRLSQPGHPRAIYSAADGSLVAAKLRTLPSDDWAAGNNSTAVALANPLSWNWLPSQGARLLLSANWIMLDMAAVCSIDSPAGHDRDRGWTSSCPTPLDVWWIVISAE